MNGYLHPDYAASLAEFGAPLELPQCRGWLLKRKIPNSSYYDAMGCYPLFVCQNWSRLHSDLENIGDHLISLSLVTDPFGDYNEAYLNQCFDMVVPFKDHYIIDLHSSIKRTISKHHKYYARKALKNIQVEICPDPTQFANEWVTLYNALINRHNIQDFRKFSEKTLTKQLSIPGMVMFRAECQGTMVGAFIWFVQGETGYAHLISFSEAGFKLGASYALVWSAIEYFFDKIRWLDIGAGSGIVNNTSDGLNFFKRGWSNGIRTVYFCGRIFDYGKYQEIVKKKGIPETDYFPAYRRGEFG